MEITQHDVLTDYHGDFAMDFVNEYSDNTPDQRLGNLSYDFPVKLSNESPGPLFSNVGNSLLTDVYNYPFRNVLTNLPESATDHLLNDFTGSHFNAIYDQPFETLFNLTNSATSEVCGMPLPESECQLALVQPTAASILNDDIVLSLDTMSTTVPGFYTTTKYASTEEQKLGLSRASANVNLGSAMGINFAGIPQSMLPRICPDQPCTTGWRQRQVVTSDDWEDTRPFIEQLYLVEEVDLKSLMRIIEVNFGLTATEQMYKKRLKSWGYRKNYKAFEKLQLARVMRSRYEQNVGWTDFTFRKRPAKLDRVRRFCKQQKLLQEVVDNLYSLPCSASAGASQQQRSRGRRVMKHANHQVTFIEPQRFFSRTSDGDRVELILVQTKAYLSWKYAGVDGIMTEDDQHLFYHKWRDGVDLLDAHKQAQGWQQIQAGCDTFASTLADPRQPILADILDCFAGKFWSQHRELRNHLLRFLAKVAGVKFGANHPLSMIFFHLQDQQVFDQAATVAMNVLVDVSSESPAMDQSDLFSLKCDFCNALIQHGHLDSAEKYIKCLLLAAETTYGYNSPEARRMLEKLSRYYFYSNDLSAATSSYEEVLTRGRRDLQHNFPDYMCTNMFVILAGLYERTADFARCQDCWYRCIEGLIHLQMMDDGWVISWVEELEDAFRRNGWDASQWFQQNFNISLAEYWERYGWE